MYSTYEAYREQGGTLPEASYSILAAKAASVIDYETLGRAASAPDEMEAALSSAECGVIEILRSYQKAAGGLASEQIDGYSYSLKADPTSAQHKEILDVLRRYLFVPSIGINLLYRGLGQ